MEQNVKTNELSHTDCVQALKKEVKGDMRQSVLLQLIEKLEQQIEEGDF
jgi:anti-sigma28 factor (negative regulator of flagellin synthesis)|tara:strand:+ start:559 stop:705 length:147 start_codon:yes stop_codon:yes gene_type:complete